MKADQHSEPSHPFPVFDIDAEIKLKKMNPEYIFRSINGYFSGINKKYPTSFAELFRFRSRIMKLREQFDIQHQLMEEINEGVAEAAKLMEEEKYNYKRIAEIVKRVELASEKLNLKIDEKELMDLALTQQDLLSRRHLRRLGLIYFFDLSDTSN